MNYSRLFSDYDLTKLPDMDFRRKERQRVCFYKSGNIKSVYLNSQTDIESSIGNVACELITFYESGKLKRLFPRYGAISAYWSEKDEARITKEITIPVGGNEYVCRPQCIHFYESGNVKSITIYDCETMDVATRYGIIKTNVGVSFYEDGSLESLEPVIKTSIEIDGKMLKPFDFFANHMHADYNSLRFDKEGFIISYIGNIY